VPKIDLTESKRLALALIARREIETNRYPLAPQLEPLKTAIAKLVPGEDRSRLYPRGQSPGDGSRASGQLPDVFKLARE
jgi:hypothetical protein